MTERVPTIHIDTDRPCSACGKAGTTTDSGVCLKCITARLKRDPDMRGGVRRAAMEASGGGTDKGGGAPTGTRDDVDTVNTTDHLKVQLTTEQKIELGEEITQHYAKLEELDSQLAGIKKQIGGEIETVKGALGKAIGTLREGYRYDSVEVIVEKDFRMGELRKTRCDMGEIYFTRALTGEERQRHLFGQQDTSTGAGEGDGDD